jgi:hypothetical protein
MLLPVGCRSLALQRAGSLRSGHKSWGSSQRAMKPPTPTDRHDNTTTTRRPIAASAGWHRNGRLSRS